MSSKCKCVFAFMFVAAVCFAQTNPHATVLGQTESTQLEEKVKQLNSTGQYCRTVEKLQRSDEPIRFFSAQGHWYKGNPPRSTAPDSVASVWLKDGRVVAATISSQATAGTGVDGVNYCFREDGTLAKVTVLPLVRSSGLAGLHTEVTVGRTAIYLANGQRLQFPAPSFDPHVFKSERTTFRYVEPAVYKSIDELPFINLILRQV